MSFIKNMKLKNKIALEFTLVSIISSIIGIIGMSIIGISSTLKVGIILGLSILAAFIFGRTIAYNIVSQINKLAEIAEKISRREIDVHIQANTNDEIGWLTNSFNVIIENIKEQTEAIEMISKGNFDLKIQPKSDKDIFVKSLYKARDSALSITKGIPERLLNPIREGNLDVRGREELYEGGWKELVQNINLLIQAFVEPIEFTNEYIRKAANGEELELIEKDDYKGEFKKLTDNMNLMRNSLYALRDETVRLSKYAVEGDLSKRADTTKVNGGYENILAGMNATLDAVIAPIKEAEKVLNEMSKGNLKVKVVGDYKGDHTIIKNALNTMAEGILNHIEETSEVLLHMSKGI